MVDHIDDIPVWITVCLTMPSSPGAYGSIWPAVQNLLLAARGQSSPEAGRRLQDAEQGPREAQRDSQQAQRGAILLEFRLTRGAYATTVLREIFALDADYDESST